MPTALRLNAEVSYQDGLLSVTNQDDEQWTNVMIDADGFEFPVEALASGQTTSVRVKLDDVRYIGVRALLDGLPASFETASD